MMRTRAKRMAARHDRDCDARHQARRGCARADHGAGGNSRRMGERGGAMENPQRAASRHRAARCARRRATFEYMLYQALLGAWQPDDEGDSAERMQAYALKAAREGKQETSWLNPNQAYEAGLKSLHRTDSGSARPRLNSWIRCETLAQRVCAVGRAEFAEPDHAEGHDAGCAGFLSGHRVLGFFARRSRQPPAGGFCRARRRRSQRWRRRIGRSWCSDWPRWPSEAGLDAASPEASHRTCRCVRTRRLPAAGGERTASRSRHRFRAAARPRRGRSSPLRNHSRRSPQGGRIWPPAKAFDGTLDIKGYTAEGGADELQLRLSHLPVAVLRRTSRAAFARSLLNAQGRSSTAGRPAKPCATKRSLSALASMLGSRQTDADCMPDRSATVRHHCFVSSRLPRLRIAACATSAKRCSSHGSITSTVT